MQNATRDIAIISLIAAALLFVGIRGVSKKERAFERKDLSDAHYILSLGETATGVVALAYVVHWIFHH